MIVIDASVAIGHVRRTDLWHERAGQFLRDVAGAELFIHPLTLAGVLAGVVRYGRELRLVADLASVGIEAMRPDDDEAVRLARLRAGTRLKMPDCCVLSAARQLGGAVATFDARLAQAALDAGFELAIPIGGS